MLSLINRKIYNGISSDITMKKMVKGCAVGDCGDGE
jgi:hypothetical protein